MLYFSKDDISVSGSGFSLGYCPGSIYIGAGLSGKPFDIEFNSTGKSPGVYNGLLTISSNADNSPTSCDLVAEVRACGKVKVDPSTVDFGNVAVGDSSDEEFDLQNVGDTDLHVSDIYVDVCESDFKIVDNPTPCTISPGDYVEVTVRFIPTEEGTRSGGVCIESDGVDEEVLNPALLGNGVGIEEARNVFLFCSLGESYPNPFLQTTIIRYSIACPSHISLKIYSLAGETVRTLINEQQKAGYYTIHWDGKDNNGNRVAPGIYFYRLEAGEFKASKKLVILR
jgi:hypothetical protein